MGSKRCYWCIFFILILILSYTHSFLLVFLTEKSATRVMLTRQDFLQLYFFFVLLLCLLLWGA